MFLNTTDRPIHKISRGSVGSRNLPAKIILCNTFLCIMCIIRQHRQDWSEDFFSHHGIRPVHVRHHRRCNAQRLLVILSAADDFFRIHQSQQSVKMLFVNDFPIIRILQGIFSKLSRDLRPDSSHQSVADPDITQHIIRCHTGLPQFRYFPNTILLAASGSFAVASTIQGLFPPSSSVTGVKYSVALLSTSRPTVLPPVKNIISKRCCNNA